MQGKITIHIPVTSLQYLHWFYNTVWNCSPWATTWQSRDFPTKKGKCFSKGMKVTNVNLILDIENPSSIYGHITLVWNFSLLWWIWPTPTVSRHNSTKRVPIIGTGWLQSWQPSNQFIYIQNPIWFYEFLAIPFIISGEISFCVWFLTQGLF